MSRIGGIPIGDGPLAERPFRMKTPLLALVVLMAPALAQSYSIDNSHTSVMFKIKHLNVSWFYGRFNEVSGVLNFDEDVKKCTIEVKINAESIDTNNAARERHLKGPDFFNVGEFPTITFKSKQFEKLEDGSYRITGTLSLHGVSKEIVVEAVKTGEGKDPWGGYRIGFEADFSIKRSDFGMNYMPEGLSDDVHMTISLEGIRK